MQQSHQKRCLSSILRFPDSFMGLTDLHNHKWASWEPEKGFNVKG